MRGVGFFYQCTLVFLFFVLKQKSDAVLLFTQSEVAFFGAESKKTQLGRRPLV